jgi:hypothetical protein
MISLGVSLSLLCFILRCGRGHQGEDDLLVILDLRSGNVVLGRQILCSVQYYECEMFFIVQSNFHRTCACSHGRGARS